MPTACFYANNYEVLAWLAFAQTMKNEALDKRSKSGH